jgi:NADH:ubiquinone oxidoreductase subunit 6 (subunit J)
MIAHKISKIVMIVLGVLAFGLLFYTMSVGEDAIKANEDGVQASTVTPFIYLGYVMMGIIILFVLIFVVLNLLKDPKALKKSLGSVGALLVVILIAYFGFADGSDAANNAIKLESGEYLTEDNSKLIGAALYTFYIIAFLAVASIIWSGATKLIKK